MEQQGTDWNIGDYCIMLNMIKRGRSDSEIAAALGRTEKAIVQARRYVLIPTSPDCRADVVQKLRQIDAGLYEHVVELHRKTRAGAWTESEVATLLDLYIKGGKWSDIAGELGRTRDACIQAWRYVVTGGQNLKTRPELDKTLEKLTPKIRAALKRRGPSRNYARSKQLEGYPAPEGDRILIEVNRALAEAIIGIAESLKGAINREGEL